MGAVRHSGVVAAITLALISIANGALATPAKAAQCTQASLSGGYGLTLKGMLREGGLVAAVGQVNFDGAGRFKAQGSSSRNGELAKDIVIDGAYSLDSDCTGHVAPATKDANLIFPSGYFVFAPAAGELRLVTDDKAVMADLIAKRQFAGPPGPCGVAAAAGRFISSGEGPILGAGAFAAVGMLIFDGKGAMHIERTLNYNGEMLPSKAADAQYKLNGQCYGELYYNSEKEFSPRAATTYDTLVVDDDGNEVRILSANPGRVLTVSGLKQEPLRASH